MTVGKRCISVAALVLVLVIGIACGDDDDGATTSGHPTASVLNEIALTMSDELSFDPNEIEVKVGKPVRLSVQNPGTALHDFTVEEIEVEDVMSEGSEASPGGGHGMDTSSEYDLHVAVDGGASGTLEFTPTAAGEYEFRCTVTGHAEGGMIGTLTVSD